jgi:DNA-binding IclR family transcriptional regulator
MAAVLDFMADHPGQAFALTDLVRALKLSRATCHALLTGLVEVGYLYRSSDKTYVLGPALAAIGQAAVAHFGVLDMAKPEMRRLADDNDVVCAAVFREGDYVTVREKAASVSHVGNSLPIGARPKLRTPYAATFLAWTPDEAQEWLDRAEPAPSEAHRAEMLGGIGFARENGFVLMLRNPAFIEGGRSSEQIFGGDNVDFPATLATSMGLNMEYEVLSITAPVFNASGHVEFVMAMMGFARIMRGAEIAEVAGQLQAACARIGKFVPAKV